MATARSCGVLFAIISAMALLGLNNTDLIDFIKPSQAAAPSFNPNGTENFSVKRHFQSLLIVNTLIKMLKFSTAFTVTL